VGYAFSMLMFVYTNLPINAKQKKQKKCTIDKRESTAIPQIKWSITPPLLKQNPKNYSCMESIPVRYQMIFKNLVQIVNYLNREDKESLFKKQVNQRQFPDYANYVETPMSLEHIKCKLYQNKYEYIQDFKQDLGIMFTNAYKFNGVPLHLSYTNLMKNAHVDNFQQYRVSIRSRQLHFFAHKMFVQLDLQLRATKWIV